MDPRRFPLGARFGGWALSLMLALAACTDRELPMAVPTRPQRPSMSIASGHGPVSVSAGGSHTCALKTDGTVACWGDNTFGQAMPPAGTFTQVSAGGGHTCAVKTDGTVACWGANGDGQTDAPAGTFTQVSAGNFHTCAVRTDGTVACWGANGDGQTDAPAGTFTQVSAGGRHTCAVKTDGTVTCWGYNGSGATDAPAGTFTQVSAGAEHTCALRTDGTVACWGGTNDFGETAAPAGTFTQVSAGGFHTCGVQTGGGVACWGKYSDARTPVPPGTFTQVSAGFKHTCAVRRDLHHEEIDGTVACWGSGIEGQTLVPGDLSGDGTPPSITPIVTGTAGTNGWYIGDVTVSWTVFDPESAVISRPCLATTISADTPGQVVVCGATSNGGTTTQSVTIKRDATKPTLAPVVSPSPVLLNGTATAQPNATDASDGSGIASSSCDTPNTGGVGSQSVTCRATDNAGNTATATASYQVTAVTTQTRVWVGLKNSDDVGTFFDLQVEVLRNGAVLATGQLNGAAGGSSGFNNAAQRLLSTTLSQAPVYGPGDVLGVRISARIAEGVAGHRSGTARLWYNDASANSRAELLVNGQLRTYYLTSGFGLSTTPGVGARATADVTVDRLVNGNAFKTFGSWSLPFPAAPPPNSGTF